MRDKNSNQSSGSIRRNSTPARELFSNEVFYVAFVVLVCVAVFLFGRMNNIWARPWGFWNAVYCIKTGIEALASCFALFYIAVSLVYKQLPSLPRTINPHSLYQNVAVAYLCCDDLEPMALHSIAATCAKHQIRLLVHDDSTSAEYRCSVNDIVALLRRNYAVNIDIVRRAERTGGKPGAVNNIVGRLTDDIEFLLLCDSDSFLPEEHFLEDALSWFADSNVALVQFRNIGYVFPGESPGYKVLAESVDFYDAFVSFMDRFGWSPFLGHNALLRVSVLKELGGFTPGQLADDIDYSVRVRLRGYQIRYARAIVAGERHPFSNQSLRRRTQKWAYGCTQVLKRWTWSLSASDILTPQEKVSFFLTVGYYHFQVLLLAYLVIFFVCVPFDNDVKGGTCNLMLSAGAIIFFTFLPSITYFVRNGSLSAWPRAAIYWGITYGSQDFIVVAAILRCVFRRQLGWAPTNGRTDRLLAIHCLPELLFGLLVVAVAAWKHPTLLLLPTTFLFAGKFLISPWLDQCVFGFKSTPQTYSVVAGEKQEGKRHECIDQHEN